MFCLSRTFKVVALLATLALAMVVATPRAGADPSIGVNPGGPLALPGGGVLEPAPGAPMMGPLPAPVVAMAGVMLGLPAGVTIDDISYGDDVLPPGPWHLEFSVAAGSVGHPGSPPVAPLPNVTAEGPATPPGDQHVEGDIYSSFQMGAGPPLGAFGGAVPPAPPCVVQSNIQSADGNGLGPLFGIANVGLGLTEPLPLPPPFGDDLDKLDMTDPTVIAPGGMPVSPVFFTIDAASVGLMPLLPPNFSPPSAATVYAWVPGFGLADWAPAAVLGLAGANDIDALSVSYTSGAPIMVPPGWIGPPDVIRFSLAPGSAANPGLGSFCLGPGSGQPGDVYADVVPFGAPPAPFLDAEMLGLNTVRSGGTGNDNLDAMDICLGSGIDADGDLIDNNCDFDRDGDLVGNAIDNCPDVPNPTQTDSDFDGIGDACDVGGDADGDGIGDAVDNCPTVFNPGQADNDAPGGPFGGTQAWITDGTAPEGSVTGGDDCDTNDDNNGCSDVAEPGLVPPRDPMNPWDFADMWVPSLPAAGSRNGAITIADAIAAISWIGTFNGGGVNANGNDYDNDSNANGIEDGAEYDRTPGAGISGPPTGAVSIADVLVVIGQIGDVC